MSENRKRRIGKLMLAHEALHEELEQLDDTKSKPREKQPSLAEIDAKLDRIAAADERFDDPEENTLSMHLPGGTRISARGAKAIRASVLIALLLALAAGLVLVGRMTAPHPNRQAPATAPK